MLECELTQYCTFILIIKGIASSEGVASDFQGSYYVGDRGRMAFGAPTRALRMRIDDLPGKVKRINVEYSIALIYEYKLGLF